MAKERLSGATYVTRGYGQVEPNHLSAQRTGQIYAQLPLAATLTKVENGQFVKYDYANNEVNTTSANGEFMLVYNEVKLYDAREQYEDFVLEGGVPRVFKTNVGDIFTTNTIKADPGSLATGDKLTVGTDGYLTENSGEAEGMVWQVAKVYTLADGQPAVKIVRIQ